MAFHDFLPSLFSGRAVPTGPANKVLFMQDFRGATHPLPRDEAQTPLTRLWVTPSGGEVELKFSSQTRNFKVTERNMIILEHIVARTPGRGHGDEAMTMLAQMADERGVHIGMFMHPIAHKAKSMEELIIWAARYGFEEYNNPAYLFWREPGAAPKRIPRPE